MFNKPKYLFASMAVVLIVGAGTAQDKVQLEF